jgi:hypothetical protein
MKKIITKKSASAPVAVRGYSALLGGVSELLESARRASARAVNAFMTATYWEIGRRIVEFEQGGERRAEYGEELLKRLAQDLSARLGRGFSRQNLQNMRLLYLSAPPDRICQTLSGKLAEPGNRQTTSGKSSPASTPRRTMVQAQTAPSSLSLPLSDLARAFPLPWSHYVLLIGRSRSPEAFAFYQTEALRGGWSVRQLQRQMDSQFYERTALSRDKAAMLSKGAKPQPGDAVTADEEIRHPLSSNFSACATSIPRATLKTRLSATSKPFSSNWATTSPSSAASAACASTTNGIAWICSSSTAGCVAWSSST